MAIGGSDKKAYLIKVEQEDGENSLKFSESEKEIAMCFDSAVTKSQFCAGGKLLGVSEDSHVQIMDIDSKKVISFV